MSDTQRVRNCVRRLLRRECRYCPWCGKELRRTQRTGRYCSPGCQVQARRAAGGEPINLTRAELARLTNWLKEN